ncbi:tyrosine-type recombinase/integrase [Cyanobacterium aponinum UTEX 3221]|uniref:site-specific integrase n=1 Tax=Cyanobacterium aponinum TaxID=379064 RepID=UPI002B4BDF4A|nr:tyrosine-type recombinase/integrase [Cyanobacterium aponinum]WRL38812.1 tyrosine-type recombinase/integrase [Cyanobacterium aponinum UTEX 3221]
MARAKKGTISVENFRGMLRLYLPRTWFNGKKKYFSLGLPDTPENRKIAEAKVGLMTADYIYERFDFTLEKYRLDTAPQEEKLSMLDIYSQYVDFKKHLVKPSSVHNFTTTLNKLKEMPDSVIKSPSNIRSWLVEHNTQEQARRVMQRLTTAYDWAIEQGITEEPNPFKKFKKIKKVSDPSPDPFTRNERDLIIETFEKINPHFANFVKFLFFTGCRPSEACGLRWENVDMTNGKLRFCEAVVMGKHQQGTKTLPSREFPINNQLREILESEAKKAENVFLSERGKPIDLHNFSQRKWKPLLNNLPIRYRGLYHCRHTFITLCLDSGISIRVLAKWVGNSPEIILRHYAGLSKTEVPEL